MFLRQKPEKQKEEKTTPPSFGQPWQKWELMDRAHPAKRSDRPRDKVLLVIRGNTGSHCGEPAAWKTGEQKAVGTSGKAECGSFEQAESGGSTGCQPQATGSAHRPWGRTDTRHPRGHSKHLPTPSTPLYLRDRGAVPLTGGGLMHHPLGKELFQAHVIIQNHLQERALGAGGETGGYPGGTL